MSVAETKIESGDVHAYMQRVGQQARDAAIVVARAEASVKNRALLATATILDSARRELAEANRQDLENGRANGLTDAMLDRLELTPERIDTMIEGLPSPSSNSISIMHILLSWQSKLAKCQLP